MHINEHICKCAGFIYVANLQLQSLCKVLTDLWSFLSIRITAGIWWHVLEATHKPVKSAFILRRINPKAVRSWFYSITSITRLLRFNSARYSKLYDTITTLTWGFDRRLAGGVVDCLPCCSVRGKTEKKKRAVRQIWLDEITSQHTFNLV